MKVFAVVAEFNPFHNGHKYLIDSIRRADEDAVFVAVMSGNFIQRGEAAVFDKWQRAKAAVLGGIDLVIELPAVFSVRSAEGFARGAVDTLNKLNCVDALCFGSENNDITILKKAASILNSYLHSDIIKKETKTGIPYAAAVDKILAEHIPQSSFSLKEPNTILAIEYLRAIEKLNAGFASIAIKRKKAQHNNNTFTGEFSSASSIRTILKSDNAYIPEVKAAIPDACYRYMREIIKSSNDIANTGNLSDLLIGRIRSSSLDELRKFAGVNSGLEFKLMQAAAISDTMNALIDNIKSKHFHYSRLQRTLIHILLDLTKDNTDIFDQNGAAYARVLAFNSNGRLLLRQINKTSDIPVISKTTQFITQKGFWQKHGSYLQDMLSYDILATDLYALCFNKIKPSGRDFCTSPIYIP